MGISALMAYRGDIVLAKAAEEAGIPMIMSGSSLIRLEDVNKIAPRAWFQAYLPGEPERIRKLVDRVAAAGFKTLVVTVDVSVLSNRENNVRAGFSTPLRPSLRLAWDGITHPRWSIGTFWRTIVKHGLPHFENSFAERGAPIIARNIERDFSARDHLNWTHVEEIRRYWKGRLVLKGVLSAEDAKIARASGIDGIIVSNHGGRQLDGSRAPFDQLAEIVDAVGDRMEVILDGGVRRGTHVLKALSVGAKAVSGGRMYLYALAAAGQAGVERALGLMEAEIVRDMKLMGKTSIDQLTRENLRWR